MEQLRLEHWTCSNKETEEHYFLAGSERFVGGYNPEYISKEYFEAFLRGQGYELPGREGGTDTAPTDGVDPCGGGKLSGDSV